MDSFSRDLRYVVRALARAPGFFATTVLTLALGIGATTAIYSVISGVLLRPLPYPGADRIVQLWQVNAARHQTQLSDPNFEDLRAQSRGFALLAQMQDGQLTSVSGGTEPVRVRVSPVAREFFAIMGVGAALGRTFVAEEQRYGGTPAVVVSHRFWQQSLGASPDVLGKVLTFQGKVFTIVGVMPPALDFPVGTDLWMPRELVERLPSRTAHNWKAVGRLKDGVTVEQARAEVSAIARRLKATYGDDTRMVDAAVVPLREQLVGRVKPALLVLLAASAVLLLIACANVVNLLLARLAARRGELAVRLALGASRGRLAQQFLAESLVLSLTGGVLGVVLAALGVKALLVLDPGNLPRAREIGIDVPVLLFALGVSVAAATALGLVTAWRGTRGELREALAEAQRSQSGAGASQRVRGALVVAQVAMALVLLVGASLLGRSFVRLLDVHPGFQTTRLVVLDVSLPRPAGVDVSRPGGSDAPARQVARFDDDLIAGVRAIPGVTAAGGVNALPLAGGDAADGTFLILRSRAEAVPSNMDDFGRMMKDTSRTGEAEFRVASPGYFTAMGIPLLRGRLFDDRDAPDGEHVAVISESLAKTRWPHEDPTGKVIEYGNMDGDLRPITVVGVVGDVREVSLAAEPRPTFYVFYRQRPTRASTFFVAMRTTSDPAPIITAARRIVRTLRPDVPPRFRTIETVVASSVADRRFVLLLVGVFGGAALVLATLGVYGVISYLVAQREREIGIRVALGARTPDVLRLVVRQGAMLAVVGVAIGAAAALALTRLLAGLLFGVSATDPVSFLTVMLALVAVAAAASFIPARRASRVDPMNVMRGG